MPFYTPSRRSYVIQAAQRIYEKTDLGAGVRGSLALFIVVNSMNLSPFQSLFKSPRRRRAVSALTVLALIAFLFTANSVQAGPVRINQVVQTVSNYQGPADLRVGTVVQNPGSSPVKGSIPGGGPRNDGPIASGDSANLDQLLSGFPIVQDPQKLGVEIVEEAEVEGTICDCGELLLAGGGFPKWPLLFLTVRRPFP